MPDFERLPYRPCVGAVIFNAAGLVWIGKRTLKSERLADAPPWQMPQGGVDPGEDPLAAARREIREETGIMSLDFLAEAQGWLSYDFPPEVLAEQTRKQKFRGQTQKWYAFRFTGPESEIDILEPEDGDQEFSEWRWARLEELPDLIIAFKRPVYEQVVEAFRHLSAETGQTAVSPQP